YTAIKIFQGVFQAVLILIFFTSIPESFFSKIGLNEKVSYPFLANVISAFSGVLLLSPILTKVRFYFNKELFFRMFKYAFPVMIAGLAFALNENLDKIILRSMVNDSDAGAYVGCYKIAVLIDRKSTRLNSSHV